MEHVVFFPAPDGSAAFRRVVTLEDAVRFVEHLRNVEGIDQFSVHTLTEVPLAFKAYYRVEVPGEGGQAVEAQQVAEHPAEAPAAEVPAEAAEAAPEQDAAVVVPEQEQPVAAAAPAKSSMGFFSRG